MKKRILAAALSAAMCAAMALPAAALEVEQARTLLNDHYIYDLPAAALEAQTLEELFSSLNDPYTVYYTAEEYKEFLESVNGETLVGIGVSIQNSFHDGYELMGVLPDSPALEAGLKPGDKLIAIDGQILDEHTAPNVLIAGEAGTFVTVTVRTPDGHVREVTMERRVVQIPIITYERAGTAGYIDCTSFGESTASVVRDAISDIGEHCAVWVMDLRSNPGGSSNSAVSTAGAFVGSAVLCYFRDAQDQYSFYYTSSATKDLTNKPLIILTSPYSASASELFSAAIRDMGAGISVGQRTYGKGIAQHVFDKESHPELFDGDAMKLTTLRFFSPIGTSNDTIGVLPTLLVSEENTPVIAQLLSCYEPDNPWGYLKLELAGQTFYIKTSEAMKVPAAFAELLEALPPEAVLWSENGFSPRWSKTTPEAVAAQYALDYQPRSFSDLEGVEYAREIRTLATYGLVSGNDGLFLPEQTLTRAQLCTILAGALNLSPDERFTFTDVAPDAWYADAVSAMAARGFVSGTGEGRFSPDTPVTHSELAAMLSAIAVWMDMDTHTLNKEIVDIDEWLTVYHYPEWAQSAARNLLALELPLELENPGQNVDRGTAAGIICRLLEETNIIWNGKDMK